jgi:putative cardiolipin synthase
MARLSALAGTAAQSEYGRALTHDARDRLFRSRIDITWVPAKLVADPPEKAAGEAEAESLVAGQMLPYLNNAESSLHVSSAYFVPRDRGTEFLSEMSERGVDVFILTNSMDSTDVLPVYGHYARSRKELLSAGVSLYELRPDANRADRDRLGLGLSQSSLHTKAFVIDRKYLFIGSFNWDPRSVWLNNEMGVLIESPALSKYAVGLFRENLRKNAYRLQLDERGGIDWLTYREDDGVNVLYPDEPVSSGWRTFKSRVFGVLPFGRQL